MSHFTPKWHSFKEKGGSRSYNGKGEKSLPQMMMIKLLKHNILSLNQTISIENIWLGEFYL